LVERIDVPFPIQSHAQIGKAIEQIVLDGAEYRPESLSGAQFSAKARLETLNSLVLAARFYAYASAKQIIALDPTITKLSHDFELQQVDGPAIG
jgi:hypothetical protein